MQTLFSITSSEFTIATSREMYPYTQLHLGRARSVATAGPHFLVLGSECVILVKFFQPTSSDTELGFRTGKLEGSTTSLDEKSAADLLKSGPIRFSAVDAEFKHLVTVGDDKKLKVWELDGPKLRSQRFAPPSAFVHIPDVYSQVTSQRSPETADLVKPREGRPNNPRLR